MVTPRMIGKMAALALLALAPTRAYAQANPAPLPAQPVARQGQVLDVSGDPVLATLPGTRLTVDIDRQQAQRAAEALSVGGLAVAINPGPYPRLDDQLVTLHLHEVPFMEGLMELRQQLRARVSDTSGVLVTLIYQPNEEVPPWCVAGPFAVQYYGISNAWVFPFDVRAGAPQPGGPKRRTILRLDLLAEPGVHVAQAIHDVRCPGLEDDKHQPIGIGPARPMGVSTLHPVDVELTLPQSPGRRIPLLKGTVDAKIVNTVAVELDNVTEKQTPPPVEGMTLEVAPLASRNGSTIFYTMLVTYSRGTLDPARWAQLAPLLPGVELRISGSGRGLISARSLPPPRGAGPAGATLPVLYNVTISPDAGLPGPATLAVPVDVLDVRVPFEFKDVLIP